MKHLRSKLRRFLIGHGLLPNSFLARFTLWTAGLWLIFLIATVVTPATSSIAGTLAVWSGILKFFACVLALLLLMRWARRQLMWRLRNRLIVTYVFIGVIPVVIVAAMALVAFYFFAGQFSTYVASQEIQAEQTHVRTASATNGALLQRELERAVPPEQAVEAIRQVIGRQGLDEEQIVAYIDGREFALRGASLGEPLPDWMDHNISGTVNEKGQLYLFSAEARPAGKHHMRLLTRVPLNQALLEKVASSLGEVIIFTTLDDAAGGKLDDNDVKELQQNPKTSGFVFKSDSENNGGHVTVEGKKAIPSLRGGKLLPAAFRGDYMVSFGGLFEGREWKSGKDNKNVLAVRTRPSLLYARLFSISGDFAAGVLRVLIGLAIFFAVIVLIALLIGGRITRSITAAVAALYRATQHVNRGDFSHRIAIRSKDQLAALEQSFNSMTESVEKLLQEQKEKERLESELAIAQEVQNQLFPTITSTLRSLELHGVCRPARTVSGDYYDFIPYGDDQLVLALGDISGKGISAALLMATLHSAVRAYEFGRVPEAVELVAAGAAAINAAYPEARSRGLGHAVQSPAQVMWLLNRHLFHSTRMEKYATLFLGLYDGNARTLTYSNAGHLPPLVIDTRGNVRKLEEGGMVIGLFDNISYEEQTVDLRPGEIFAAYSDGITEPENEYGEFGEARLIELIRENHHLPLERISEIVTTAVQDWIGGAEQPDDVTLVLARVA